MAPKTKKAEGKKNNNQEPKDELPAKKPRKDEAATGENLPRYHWVYSIEPHDPAIDTWQKLPEELREAVELLLLDSPPKELWLPSSLVIGKYHAEVEKNLHKKWKVMENNLHTSDRTAVLSLQDGKIRKKGIHMFVHFRWRLKEDTALWMGRPTRDPLPNDVEVEASSYKSLRDSFNHALEADDGASASARPHGHSLAEPTDEHGGKGFGKAFRLKIEYGDFAMEIQSDRALIRHSIRAPATEESNRRYI